MNLLKHLRAAGALAVEAERQAADWSAVAAALAPVLGAAGAAEVVGRLRNPAAAPLSPAPVNLDAVCAIVREQHQDAAEEMDAVPEKWQAFRRAVAAESAATMTAVRDLQRCRPAAVADALAAWPALARQARRIAAEYSPDPERRRTDAPAGDCPSCRLVTDLTPDVNATATAAAIHPVPGSPGSPDESPDESPEYDLAGDE